MEKKLTKKAFKEGCSLHHYGKYKVIYYDWADNFKTAVDRKFWVGFKYAVMESRGNPVKTKEMYDMLYDWVVNGVNLPWYMNYRYAETDEKRFKVPVSMSF